MECECKSCLMDLACEAADLIESLADACGLSVADMAIGIKLGSRYDDPGTIVKRLRRAVRDGLFCENPTKREEE